MLSATDVHAAAGSAALSSTVAVGAQLFARPREKLHRTQPAVSQAIRRLEEELGERLFDRSSRDGTLTEAGRLLLDYAARLLRLADGSRAAVRELRRSRRGRVVIGANEAAVHALLPLIERFAREHPQALRRRAPRPVAPDGRRAAASAASTSAC